MSTEPFKYIVGQEVRILSKVRHLNGRVVKVVSRHHVGDQRWYKVGGEGIHQSLSYYEDQLALPLQEAL